MSDFASKTFFPSAIRLWKPVRP